MKGHIHERSPGPLGKAKAVANQREASMACPAPLGDDTRRGDEQPPPVKFAMVAILI
jgi:hypothetical protein